jgi:hypothetical protein
MVVLLQLIYFFSNSLAAFGGRSYHCSSKNLMKFTCLLSKTITINQPDALSSDSYIQVLLVTSANDGCYFSCFWW